jgi:hypothetical protein
MYRMRKNYAPGSLLNQEVTGVQPRKVPVPLHTAKVQMYMDQSGLNPGYVPLSPQPAEPFAIDLPQRLAFA